jgi:hypothetical protein
MKVDQFDVFCQICEQQWANPIHPKIVTFFSLRHQTWPFIRIILTRPECNIILPPGFPRHTVSSIFYIGNVGGSSRQFETYCFCQEWFALFSDLLYYSNDSILWCSLDGQSYHQLDPELNDHQNLIGIKLFLCHPDFQIHPPEFPFRASPLPNQSSCQTIPSLIMIFLLCKQTTLLFVWVMGLIKTPPSAHRRRGWLSRYSDSSKPNTQNSDWYSIDIPMANWFPIFEWW